MEYVSIRRGLYAHTDTTIRSNIVSDDQVYKDLSPSLAHTLSSASELQNAYYFQTRSTGLEDAILSSSRSLARSEFFRDVRCLNVIR